MAFIGPAAAALPGGSFARRTRPVAGVRPRGAAVTATRGRSALRAAALSDAAPEAEAAATKVDAPADAKAISLGMAGTCARKEWIVRGPGGRCVFVGAARGGALGIARGACISAFFVWVLRWGAARVVLHSAELGNVTGRRRAVGGARIGCCFCLCAILFALACRCTFLVSAHASQGASPDLIVVVLFFFFFFGSRRLPPSCLYRLLCFRLLVPPR